MALVGSGVGRTVEVVCPWDQDPVTVFLLRVLPARHRRVLTDLEGGVVDHTGQIHIKSGSYAHEAVRLGLVGWRGLIYPEDHPLVAGGKKVAGSAIEFQTDPASGGASADVLDELDDRTLDYLAGQVRRINLTTAAQGKASGSGSLSPTTPATSAAEPAASGTVTLTAVPGDPGGK